MNIIQIGCHDGNDHVLQFVRDHLNDVKKLILIDANPNVIPYCEKTYAFLKDTNIEYKILNFAIVKDTLKIPTLKLYIPPNEVCSLHCSYSYAHMKEHFHKQLDIIDVPTNTISNICLTNNISTINYLFIDTEGMDIDIINSLPFNTIEIGYIKFEHAHSDSPFSNGGEKYDWTVQMLERLGYKINKEINDTIATK